MKVLMRVALFIVIGFCSQSYAAEPTNTEKVNAAVHSVKQWLELIDEKNYAQSWVEAAPLFKSAVTQQQWIDQLEKHRLQLGNVSSRTVSGANYLTELPNAPKGEYVIIYFKTKLANKKSVVETVTPVLGKDGHWRVSGYFIK